MTYVEQDLTDQSRPGGSNYLSPKSKIGIWSATEKMPHGSILSPHLFVVYMNNLVFNILGAQTLYADESTLLSSSRNGYSNGN